MGDDTGTAADDGRRPLAGLLVVEIGTGIAAGYAGKLFVDGGAQVVKVEPPDGDPLRPWSATGADTERRLRAPVRPPRRRQALGRRACRATFASPSSSTRPTW